MGMFSRLLRHEPAAGQSEQRHGAAGSQSAQPQHAGEVSPAPLSWYGRFPDAVERRFNDTYVRSTLPTRLGCVAGLLALQAVVLGQWYARGLSPAGLQVMMFVQLTCNTLLLVAVCALLYQRHRHRAQVAAGTPAQPLRPRWLVATGGLDHFTVFIAVLTVVVYGIALFIGCSRSDIAPRSPICRAYAAGLVPVVPWLWANLGAGLIVLMSAQPLLNAIGVFLCFALAIGSFAAFFKPASAANIALIGGSVDYYFYLVTVTVIPIAFNMVAMMAVGVVVPRGVRANFALQLDTARQAEQQLQAQREDARDREMAVQAKATTVVSNAVIAYAFHALRNPIHVLRCFFADLMEAARAQLKAGSPDVVGAAYPAAPAAERQPPLPPSPATRGIAGGIMHRQQSPLDTSVQLTRGSGRSVLPDMRHANNRSAVTVMLPKADLRAMREALDRMTAVTIEAGFYSALIGRHVPIKMQTFRPSALAEAALRQVWRACSGGVVVDAGVPTLVVGDAQLIADALLRGVKNACAATHRLIADGDVLPEDVRAALRVAGLPERAVSVLISVTHDAPVEATDWVLHPTASLLPVPRAAPVDEEAANGTVQAARSRQASVDGGQQAGTVPFLRFEVLNVGCGLPPGETVESLFSPFMAQLAALTPHTSHSGSRSSRSSSSQHGNAQRAAAEDSSAHWHTRSTGLGLPVVLLIAALLRGRCGIFDDASIRLPGIDADSAAEQVRSTGSGMSTPRGIQSDRDSANTGGAHHIPSVRGQSVPAGGHLRPRRRRMKLTRFVLEVPLVLPAAVGISPAQAAGAVSAAQSPTHEGAAAPPASEPCLPRAPSVSGTSEAAAAAASLQDQFPELAGARVMVVDDEAAVRKVNERLLRRLGCEVDVATDGDEVLPLLQAQEAAGRRYDAIMMDVIMQRQNGDDTCMQLRRSGYASLPIVAVTANAGPGDLRRYRDVGFSAVLTKPFDVAQCARIMREAGVTRSD